MLIKLIKDKRRIATAESFIQHHPKDKYVYSLFFFHKIFLLPPVMFEHLAGQSLMSFLDHCTLKVEEEADNKFLYRDLRYVHGRSEALKGQNDITSVLLAQICPDVQCTDADWLPRLPDIYRNFLKILK